jgi:hypothetical protein
MPPQQAPQIGPTVDVEGNQCAIYQRPCRQTAQHVEFRVAVRSR